MKSKKQIIQRVLLEQGLSYLLLTVGCSILLLLVIFPGEPGYIRWKHIYAQEMGRIFFPLACAGNLRSFICVSLDLWKMQAVEKRILLQIYEKDQDVVYSSRHKSEVLWNHTDIYAIALIRAAAYGVHLALPIRMDRRIVDFDYVQGHTYQVKILRFSHLLLKIEEVVDSRAIEDAISYAEGDANEAQEQIQFYRAELHEQQRKYAIQLQKYEATPDEQKKDVHYWMMHDIEVKIDELKQQIKEEEIRLKEYQKQKQDLEDKRERSTKGT